MIKDRKKLELFKAGDLVFDRRNRLLGIYLGEKTIEYSDWEYGINYISKLIV